MATIRITLPLYNRSWDLPRELLKQTFPQSILVQAIQEDPNTTQITIDKPNMTPAAMDVILEYLRGDLPSKHILELIPAARYLNLPELLPFAYPEYETIGYIVRNTGLWDTDTARDILVRAAKTGNEPLLKYLLWVGVTPGKLLHYPVHEDMIFIYSALYEAIVNDQLESFLLLLQDGRALEEITWQQILKLGVQSNAIKIVQFISEQNPEYVDWTALMKLAIDSRSLDMVKILRVHMLVHYDRVMSRAILQNVYEIVQWLLMDPGYQPYLKNYAWTVSNLPRHQLHLYEPFLDAQMRWFRAANKAALEQN